MNFKLRVRWFTGQFLVVVAGVLTALAVDSLHARSEIRRVERFYLSQLTSDLRVTEQSLHQASAFTDGTVQASAALLRAFRDPANISPDSVAHWLALIGWASMPRLNFSVAEGLVSGDLATIRSDSSRAELVSLLATAETFRQNFDVVWGMFIDYSNRLRAKAPLSERLATMMRSDSLSIARLYRHRPFGSDFTTAFPIDYISFLRDRDAYVIVDGLFEAGTDLTTSERSLATFVGTVRARLEAAYPRPRRP